MPGTPLDAVYVGTRASYQRQLLRTGRAGRAAGGRGREARLPGAGAAARPVDAEPGPDGPALGRPLAAGPAPPRPICAATAPGSTSPAATSPNTRRIVEEPELWPSLEELGFTRLDPGSVPCGSRSTGSPRPRWWSRRRGRPGEPGLRPPRRPVLELFAPDYVNPCYWAITDAVPDALYRYLVAGTPPRSPPPNAAP